VTKHSSGIDLIDNMFRNLGVLPAKTAAAGKSVGVSYSVWGFYNLTLGFLNGTQFLKGANSIQCQTTVSRYLTLTTINIEADLAADNIYQSIYDITELATDAYALENYCHNAAVDMVTLAQAYAAGYSTFEDFTDTFAYNFGLMYDSVITTLEAVQAGNWFMAGYSLGNIIYLIFFIP
jgi:hypothetical protein